MPRHSRSILRSIFLLFTVALGVVATASPGAAAVPTAPSGLTAVYTTGVMTLTWVDNALDETGFSIERCLTADCSQAGQIATVGANVTSYGDLFTPTGGGRYRVRAFNSSGPSAYSNTAESFLIGSGDVTASATAAPASGQAPLTVVFDGSASSALNGPITEWTWSFGDNQTASGVTVSHTFTTPGVYAVSMRARFIGGFGNPSAVTTKIITVTSPPPPPPAPLAVATNLSAVSPARARVQLTWTNPASSATSLVLQRCSGSRCTSFTRVATLTTSTASYLDTGVTRGTTYRYRLAASNTTGTVYSNVVTVTARR